jgi:hypothetical protein
MLWTATGDAKRCQGPTEIRGHGVSNRLSCSNTGEFELHKSLFLAVASPQELGSKTTYCHSLVGQREQARGVND